MGRRQGFTVLGEGLADLRMDLPGGMIFPVEDRRELVFEARRTARSVDELREEALRGAALAGLRQALDRAAADTGILDGRNQHLGVDSVVPQVQHRHLAELGHVLAVGPDTAEDRILGGGFAQAVVAAGDHDARRQPLEVPFPGRREGLIEVVDGEDDLPLRGGEATEVDQVGVAAALHADAGGRSARQIGRHGQRRASVKGEGRQNHAPVAKGKEFGDAPFVGLQHQADRVGLVGGGLPGRVRGAWALLTQAFAHCIALSPRRHAAGRLGYSRLRAVVSLAFDDSWTSPMIRHSL